MAHAQKSKQPELSPQHATTKAIKPSKPSPQNVYVGLYLHNIIDIDIKLNVYWVNMYLWFRWKGDIDPSKSFEFVNTFEQWGQTLIPESEKYIKQPDGWKYKSFRIEQKFHNPFFLHDYPLDKQELIIKIEDQNHTIDQLRFIADPETSYNHKIHIPSWNIISQNSEVTNHFYPLKFGDKQGDTKPYSQFKYTLTVAHPAFTYLLKILLPITIVLLINSIVFIIPITFFESRVSIIVTNLLSLIALQIVVNDALPPVGYIVLSDKLYYIAYLVVLITLIETVIVHYFHQIKTKWSQRLDSISLFSVLLLTPMTFILLLSMVR